ncbi:cystathionine beta-lyase [Acinetobacter qingfengensis]|uniref:Cystathionine beta-lyase n=1 Tax=Acinetobacter qingfengensis TaxID=1262585 RepID=A0A1E7R2X3_9GAMM|nr:PLP-dependent transferase [Acinetobacter qingfengensis]KAA8733799.1 cystathionine beta-lyase [Acinetobacter qingfengensis]OEY93689.1 cystathionine beta-lyase [Acinetobacter qingfengensis]
MQKHKQTQLSQPERQAPQYISTVQAPLYRASTIIFPNCKSFTDRHWSDAYDYSYGTHGTPTTYSLADQIATIEGADHCLLAPSGLSAIHLINSALLNTGDEVWIPDNVYGPTHDDVMELQKKYAINVKVYDPTQVETIQFGEQAKLIWIEAAGSVTLEFPDLIAIMQKAQQHQVLTALDNTWGAGLAFCAFDFGTEHYAVDISVHALTKYPSGGGDILMGSICTKNRALHLNLLRTHALQGIAISGDDAAQINRSLPSMVIRYQQHQNNTLKIIDFLKTRTEFAQILHPSLPVHTGHQYWKNICSSGLGAGLVSAIFHTNFDLQAIQKFCDQLQYFHLGFSWGGPTSLIMYYDLSKMRHYRTPHLSSGWLVRFCIGLEQAEDLIADLEQALDTLQHS